MIILTIEKCMFCFVFVVVCRNFLFFGDAAEFFDPAGGINCVILHIGYLCCTKQLRLPI